MFAINIEKLIKTNILTNIFLKKHSIFPLFIVSVVMNIKKYLEKKIQLK